MNVSKTWFFTMIADGAFAHFKRKVLLQNPDLLEVFDAHPWEFGDARTASSMRPSAAKKRRKAWIMPRGGTWYILKHYIDKARTIGGWRKLHQMRDPLSDVVLIAATKRMIPVPVEKVEINPVSFQPKPVHFRIVLYRTDGKKVSIYCRYKFSIFQSGKQFVEYSKPWKPLSAFNNCLSLHSTHSYIRQGKRTWYNHLENGRIDRFIK
jgi:hypothetical protein